ncbi:Protein SODIUM POTASSIUM ROOT DEFECTIVE 3 [Euphorbia peplus]|nr:Protein SODIUM POTASSIUM ROOT DEFECTIVE 3 [Euphorbia peplus]
MKKIEENKSQKCNRSEPESPLQPSSSSSHPLFQVVVMRVSIHCNSCASEIKKHLLKMEGVTSFSIEVKAKRVTVMGHVSPVRVLESISKLKRAEFWPLPT